MIQLKNVENAAKPWPVVQDNFEKLDDGVFKRVPSKVSGVTTDIVGPPTSVTVSNVLNQVWVDVNGAVFVCRTAGAPGVWKQIEAAVLAEFPVSPTDRYLVIRYDLDYRLYYYDLAALAWVEYSSLTPIDCAFRLKDGQPQIWDDDDNAWRPMTCNSGVLGVGATVAP